MARGRLRALAAVELARPGQGGHHGGRATGGVTVKGGKKVTAGAESSDPAKPKRTAG